MRSPSPSMARCANCETEATMRCAGCLDAPKYHPTEPDQVVYCHRGCQTAHWFIHKRACKVLRQWRKLYRAARILRAALLTYREFVFDINVSKIEFRGDTLYLYRSITSDASLLYQGRFPAHLTTSIEYTEAALATNQCTTALALLGRLARNLLAGVASSIEHVDVQIGKPLIRTMFVPGPDSSWCPHTVLNVTLRDSDEEWIIDTAGCQYGFRDVLVPAKIYLAEKECGFVNEPTVYTKTETSDLDFFATMPALNATKVQRRQYELERAARRHFAVFVDQNFGRDAPGPASDLLDGSATEFEQKFGQFVRNLQLHMRRYTKP